MKLQSLGFRSELIFTGFDGKVEDKGEFLAVHTHGNPNYFWGNLLIFNRPPRVGDFEEWTKKFKKEFTDPRIYHITLAWDSPTGEIGDPREFIENGYRLETTAVLSAKSVIKPTKFNKNLELKIISTDDHWEEMIKLQVATAHSHLRLSEWESFHRKQASRYRKMADAGFGHWYGGFLDDKLVAGLGIFHKDGIGRFQTVCTHPDFQRQGLCQTLVYLSSMRVFNSGTVSELVLCADPEYHAIKIYESVGFQRNSLDHGVYWWDQNSNGN